MNNAQTLDRPLCKVFPPRIVSDEDLAKALDWLRDSARDMGAAKERLKKAENMVKVIKQIQFARVEHRGRVALIGRDMQKRQIDALEKILFRK